jgi:F-type H+-transporting ATPase subunit epsilon
MSEAITLRVVSPDRIAVDTTASSVQFTGVDGLIGVLPGHADMVAALAPGMVIYKHGGATETRFISGGFAEVRDNTVTIVSEACESPQEIDAERARSAEERARERLRVRRVEGGELDVLRAESALARALMRQLVKHR